MLTISEDHPMYGSVRELLARKSPLSVGDAQGAEAVFRPLLFPADGSGGEVERFAVCGLDARNMVVGASILTVGNMKFTIVDPAQVYRWVLTRERPVASVLVAHNHPSGTESLSTQDLAVTRAHCRGPHSPRAAPRSPRPHGGCVRIRSRRPLT